MWADSTQITASQRFRAACKATTLAPVPLKTGKPTAFEPKSFFHQLIELGCYAVVAVGDLVAVVHDDHFL